MLLRENDNTNISIVKTRKEKKNVVSVIQIMYTDILYTDRVSAAVVMKTVWDYILPHVQEQPDIETVWGGIMGLPVYEGRRCDIRKVTRGMGQRATIWMAVDCSIRHYH